MRRLDKETFSLNRTPGGMVSVGMYANNTVTYRPFLSCNFSVLIESMLRIDDLQ